MKKLLLSLLICMGITMISSQSYAQEALGEKLQPYVGNTYTYTFKNIPENLKYEFYFSTDKIGKGDKTTGTAYNLYFNATTPATGTIPTGGGDAVVKVDWPTGAVPAIIDIPVYLFIRVYQDPHTNICENFNAVEIIPRANAFVVNFADITAGGTIESCPDFKDLEAVVEPSATYTYNAGTSELTFTATRDGGASANDWSTQFDINQVGGTVDYTYSISGGATVTPKTGSANETVTIPTITSETITITLEVQNFQGQVPVFTINNITAQDKVNLASPASITGLTHTIKEIPTIGNFE